MSDIADAIMEGCQCSWCGIWFEKAYGYPVICKDCWKNAMKDYKDEDDLRIDTGISKAAFKEL